MASPRSDFIIIDPTGDTLLTLENPGTVFAVWTEPVDAASDLGDISTEDVSEEFPCESSDGSDQSPHWTEWEETDVEHDEDERPERSEAPAPSVPGGWDEHHSIPSMTINLPKHNASTPIVYQVSSAHLTTASSKFKREIKLSTTNRKDSHGFYHLKTLNWDPEAFEILLNTLHTRYRRIPKDPSLELLAKVATIVTHYACTEAFEFISETWIRRARVRHPMPQAYDRDVILWMFVAWVFRFPKDFRKATAITLRHCPEATIQDMGLGIPSSILRAYIILSLFLPAI